MANVLEKFGIPGEIGEMAWPSPTDRAGDIQYHGAIGIDDLLARKSLEAAVSDLHRQARDRQPLDQGRIARIYKILGAQGLLSTGTN